MGIDVSHFQGAVNFKTAKANGISFTYIKATEGTSTSGKFNVIHMDSTNNSSTAFIDPEFNTNYAAATSAGLIRGAYHFAHPDVSSGATQASFFLAHGGGWSSDGITLPGTLDIECMYPFQSYARGGD